VARDLVFFIGFSVANGLTFEGRIVGLLLLVGVKVLLEIW
jgi:hypothetical protein